MPELRLQVPRKFIKEINTKLKHIHKNNKFNISLGDIGREALTHYQWAVNQVSEGRAVVSTDYSKKHMVQLGMPALPARKPTW